MPNKCYFCSLICRRKIASSSSVRPPATGNNPVSHGQALAMGKLKLTGQNLGRVFKFRRGCFHAIQLYYFETKLPNLKLKTRPKQLLCSLPVDIALPSLADRIKETLENLHVTCTYHAVPTNKAGVKVGKSAHATFRLSPN